MNFCLDFLYCVFVESLSLLKDLEGTLSWSRDSCWNDLCKLQGEEENFSLCPCMREARQGRQDKGRFVMQRISDAYSDAVVPFSGKISALLTGSWNALFSARLGRSMRPLCVFLCLLAVWGLAACGAHRSSSAPKTQIVAQKVVESAHSQIGTRYRSGGDSPGKGFDCSGLVQWAYKQQGIALPRLTTDQARAGRLIAPQEGLQPADILVFKNRRGPHGLHTGLYAGGGNFIHSPGTGQRVRTESLETAYWKKSLIGARRLIN